MLTSLLVRDFVIVDHAEIHFNPGFTVFSGETGAGKSILIDALSLTLGARAESPVVRPGAQRADICAVFAPPPALQQWLVEHNLVDEKTVEDVPESSSEDAFIDSTLILRRVIDVQGRSRAYVNGVPCTLTQLRELGEHLVDIHGQHAHQSLLRTARQRDMLDAQGGAEHLVLARQVRQSWQAWQQAEHALQQAQQDQQDLAATRERLAQQLEDFERLALKAGEWESLSARQNQLAHAQAIMEGGAAALAALEGEDSGEQTSARHQLHSARHAIQNLLRFDARLQGVQDALESASISITEAASDLQAYLSGLELDPNSLESVEARLSDIFDLARKYRVEPEELPALHERVQTEHEASVAGADLPALQAQVEKTRAAYDEHAAALTRTRRKTAKKLGEQVTRAMQTLAMQGGCFEIALNACEPSSHGNETVEFLVAGHAGSPARALNKVASGGELARLSLALSVIASQAARVPTLIFDEVDVGIGGAVAEVVGRLLRELGGQYQVLCVTHLPQVAACGNHHFQVEKSQQTIQGKTCTLSRIQALSGDENEAGRVEEIARMLGGIKVTDVTRKHARELLAGQG